jgi:hypothetical protein
MSFIFDRNDVDAALHDLAQRLRFAGSYSHVGRRTMPDVRDAVLRIRYDHG